ncbi:hypothetical protein E3Q08_04435 [Wallemia mellicola]|uniref:CxC6 like cysteine cluster associated with KDZ domain-containing protein n=1 Tax=Wallemia mellicola TaxID=1708541 RepID=A0AB38MNB9_9BASI|nr:hypothetical protein E3Q24_04433 [Wallemia mellicola]TIB77960.1 hypothetical protein E3Q21_04426 [Wallemia mellicola]TIB82270.1 hypothetical protein E3Q20_04439 [Wallemia mellicola]TIC35614.1 hypothetical protein E3Q08_04435 [Wallemia mellicola]TIC36379.1 hypothetical protein E3Q07_04422 [Wallemia mellicola]
MESGNVSQCCVQSCEEQASNDSPYCVLAHNNLREQCLINNENTLGNCHEPSCDNRVLDTELFCKLHGNKNEQGFYEQNTDNSVCIHAECDMKNIQIAPFCIESHFKQAKVYVSYVNPAACAVAGCKERANDGAPYCFRHGHHNYQWKRDQNIALAKCAVVTCFHKAEEKSVYCLLLHHHMVFYTTQQRRIRQSRANRTPECAIEECTNASSGDTNFCTASHGALVAQERAEPEAAMCAISDCNFRATGKGPYCKTKHNKHASTIYSKLHH